MKSLWRWCGWFFLGNTLIFWLVGLNYYSSFFPVSASYFTASGLRLLAVFLFFSYLGQLALLAFLLCAAIAILIWFFPRRLFIFTLAIAIATIAVMLLWFDSAIYNLYRFHLNGIVLNLIINGIGHDAFGISRGEWLIGSGMVLVLIVVEMLYAYWIWQYIILKKYFLGYGKWAAIFICGCVYLSYSMLIFNPNATTSRFFMIGARFLPFYENFLGFLSFKKNGLIALQRVNERYFVQPEQAMAKVRYPLKPMQCELPKHPYNIILIAIDAWRYDMLNQQVMPNLSEFAKESWRFTQHFSGGNATGPGIFSLYYSMPSTYWTAMEVQHHGPVFLDELLKNNYQVAVFTSGTLRMPAFNRTVFQALKNLRLDTPGANAYLRDKKITREFQQFIAQQPKHKSPFFAYLFFDSAHTYCDIPDDLAPLKPAVAVCNRYSLSNQSDPLPYLNRYKNALLLVDKQIEEVLKTLQAAHLLENTVIVFTGDHGEEFNDNHLNFWGHASNFTHYQTQVPLIIHWPQKKPAVFTHQTSHFDIVPTLLTELLHCQNAPSDYSVGKTLLNNKERPYLILGSYIGFGIMEKQRITNVFSSGNFYVNQLNGEELPDAKLNIPVMRQAFQDMHRFYLPS